MAIRIIFYKTGINKLSVASQKTTYPIWFCFVCVVRIEKIANNNNNFANKNK